MLFTPVLECDVVSLVWSFVTKQVELESWDSWGADGASSDFVRKSAVDGNVVSSGSRYVSNRYPLKKAPEPEPEPEVDYFQELNLEPSIRKTKKVALCLLT
jgi:hypothetical protein